MKTISGSRILMAWLILLMLVFFLALGVFSLTLCIYERINKPSGVVSESMKSKMKRHGIQVAECVGDKCGFWRNGEWVRL
jgi:signal peptidase I